MRTDTCLRFFRNISLAGAMIAAGVIWHGDANAGANVTVDDSSITITEPIEGSEFPVHLAYIETVDGLYTPVGIRKPEGEGPFPIILFASGNGGEGMAWVREATRNRSWTQEQFLKAGYAVAWLRYRAEVELAYHKYGKLVQDVRQGRQLLNRGPLEYEDVISVIEYVKKLPYVDAGRVGYMGMSHGGEMAFKITSEYGGLKAAIASEPANHEFLALTPDDTAHINPESGLRDIESMLMRETGKVRGRIDLDDRIYNIMKEPSIMSSIGQQLILTQVLT